MSDDFAKIALTQVFDSARQYRELAKTLLAKADSIESHALDMALKMKAMEDETLRRMATEFDKKTKEPVSKK